MELQRGADRVPQKIQVGDVTIHALTDGAVRFDPRILFPETKLDAWEPYYDRFPEYFDEKYFFNNIGAFVLSSVESNILIDSGFGPHGKMLGNSAPGMLMKNIYKSEIGPDEIDIVFLTHLHGDHIGWNMRHDVDPQRPTFVNARYMVHSADWDWYTRGDAFNQGNRSAIEKNVLPLERLGLLDFMLGETKLSDDITAFHTPGHTPGHMSILIASQNERAILIGDLAGSPMQITETDWPYMPDWDQERARIERKKIIDDAFNDNAIVFGSHLSFPGWGHIIKWKGRKYWKAI